MLQTLIVVIFFICINLVGCVIVNVKEKCDLKIKVIRSLHDEGFHRKMVHNMNIVTEGDVRWSDNCTLGMEQVLPFGVYASPDEVPNYYNNFLQSTIFLNPVDIEASASDAHDMTIMLIARIKYGRSGYTIPLHARYASAVPGGGFAKNKIPLPKFYMKCPENWIQNCDFKIGNYTKSNFCLKDNHLEKCPWKEVPLDIASGVIQWDVPRGNTDHYYLVSLGTVIVIAAGSLYLLKTIHEYKLKSKKVK